MNEAYHRALMAFPDEDVLVGTRLRRAVGLRGLQGPGRHRAPSRATEPSVRSGPGAAGWPSGSTSRPATTSRRFQVKGNTSGLFDYESLKPETVPPDVEALFKGLRPAKGDVLVAFGWAMAEDLLKLGSR